MEIYRTDGGGRYNNHPRLLKVVGNVMKHIPDNDPIWNNVSEIKDHKGNLSITFIEDNPLNRLVKDFFSVEWLLAGESLKVDAFTIGGKHV